MSVDLGTSNTVAVLADAGRPPRVVEVDGSATMPSAVYAEEDGTIMVGRDADRRARLDPTRFEPNPKRRVDEQSLLLGSDVVPVSDALSAILRRVLEETARQLGGEQPHEIRLTHPAQWGRTRCSVLTSAARQAGVTSAITLVPEPVAAAAHFASFPGRSLAAGQSLAVYDLGAGTFDVAVVSATAGGYTVLAEDGLPDLGGLDVDQALLVHVGREVSHKDPQQWQRLLRPESTADRRMRRTLQEDVKAAKEALSRHPQTEVPMPEPFTDVLVTRGELEALVRPAMLRSVELLSRTLQGAGIGAGELAGIYLVGGSSRLPLVGTMISEKLGVVPASLDQPETAVGFGAHHATAGGGPAAPAQSPAAGAHPPPAPPGRASPAQSGPVPVAPQHAAAGAPAAPGAQQPAGFPAGANPAAPGTGPQPVQSQPVPPQGNVPGSFPAYPEPPESGGASPRRGRKALVAAGVAVALLLAVGGAAAFVPLGQDTATYPAESCAEAAEPSEDGFTDCLRQLAGDVAGQQCTPGMGTGPAAAGEEFGASVTCSAPGLAGAQVTYVHADAQEDAELFAGDLVGSAGGQEQVQADWRGNALEGRYAAATGSAMSVLAFTVDDRPLFGFVMQMAGGTDGELQSPSQMADYFEASIQPGE
nr:Hsp70 family protein [Haloechinothrix aidingensis]